MSELSSRVSSAGVASMIAPFCSSYFRFALIDMTCMRASACARSSASMLPCLPARMALSCCWISWRMLQHVASGSAHRVHSGPLPSACFPASNAPWFRNWTGYDRPCSLPTRLFFKAGPTSMRSTGGAFG
jgi:hypothetical protein